MRRFSEDIEEGADWRPEEGAGLLRPISNKSVVDRIIDRLTRALLERKLLPGQKIPTELELCESMRVGRNSVREAIKVLVTMGVLVIRRSEGTFVTEGFSERMLDPMVYGLILEGGDSAQVIELRRIFEAGVFRAAIAKRDRADINALAQAIEKMRLAVRDGADAEELLELDLQYHRIIGGMAKNPLVDKINLVIERLTRPSRVLAIQGYIERGEITAFLTRHEEMLRAITDRDGAVVDRVLEEHFRLWTSISGRLEARSD